MSLPKIPKEKPRMIAGLNSEFLIPFLLPTQPVVVHAPVTVVVVVQSKQ